MSATMNATILAIAKSESLQQRLFNEIISEFDASGLITTKDSALLPYTQAVIFEALRLTSPVPIPIPRETATDTSIGGYTIPRGTPVRWN